MLAEIFLLVIVFYLLYRFVFNFLVPVIRTTRHVRQQFRHMHEGMDGRQQESTGWQQPGPGGRERHSSPKGAAEDYIDFEEIKPSKENRRQ